jgi:deoxyribonuclease-4
VVDVYLGAHMPVSGGLELAFERIRSIGGTALQVFTRNQRQWRIPPLEKRTVLAFRKAWKEWGDLPVAAHDSYLINLAASDLSIRRRSVTALSAELGRAEALGIRFLVMHPGAHTGQGLERGLEICAKGLDRAIERSGTGEVTVLLETTAGQGTGLGSTFEELAEIIGRSSHPDRIGVCLDTCHAFAAGYELRTSKGYRRTMSRFDETVGLERLMLLHLNDSRGGLGSRLDRHEHIGKGAIGLEGFRLLVRDRRFRRIPMILETPKGKDLGEDVRNLEVLRSLAR